MIRETLLLLQYLKTLKQTLDWMTLFDQGVATDLI